MYYRFLNMTNIPLVHLNRCHFKHLVGGCHISILVMAQLGTNSCCIAHQVGIFQLCFKNQKNTHAHVCMIEIQAYDLS